ncbi:hypothetical protein [Lachnospira rogosae (ex Hitch et al. 2025)]|uniref:hypothetical protein n=2 Tax=[Lactobacillus] rogosae TaxID=706562 RepID=UPI0032BF23F9
MKKKILIIMAVVTMLGISACGDKQSNQSTVTDDYRYSSYTYDDNAPQYYMAGSAAASETGYYYIDGAPVINNSNMYIYYYDMIKDMTIPLCSKVDCDHRTDECEAYISQNICVGSKIWYHNERLYMIEKTEEKDILVSYDKTMRDKKEEKTLSINGLSVNKNSKNACITNGKLYYELSGDNSLFICAVSLNSDEQAYVVKEYVSEYNYYERVSLYPIEDKIYVNWLSGVSADKSLYYIEQIDISTDKVSRLCDMNEKYPEISSTIINWNSETYFDKDGNLYFTCVDKDNYMVKKLNISTGDIKDLYVQELQHEKDYGYVHLKNYDGNYIYIYKGVNLMALSGKPLDEQFKKYDNYIYILDTDGNIKDTVILNNTDEKVSGNISAEFYGGDERCLLIGFSTHDIKGLELSEEEQNLRIKLEDEVFKNKKGFVDVNVSAILDKSQIGSGNITLEPVTPE